jgi:hypothetical protein
MAGFIFFSVYPGLTIDTCSAEPLSFNRYRFMTNCIIKYNIEEITPPKIPYRGIRMAYKTTTATIDAILLILISLFNLYFIMK